MLQCGSYVARMHMPRHLFCKAHVACTSLPSPVSQRRFSSSLGGGAAQRGRIRAALDPPVVITRHRANSDHRADIMRISRALADYVADGAAIRDLWYIWCVSKRCERARQEGAPGGASRKAGRRTHAWTASSRVTLRRARPAASGGDEPVHGVLAIP